MQCWRVWELVEKEVVRMNGKFGKINILRKSNSKFRDNELFFSEVSYIVIFFLVFFVYYYPFFFPVYYLII